MEWNPVSDLWQRSWVSRHAVLSSWFLHVISFRDGYMVTFAQCVFIIIEISSVPPSHANTGWWPNENSWALSALTCFSINAITSLQWSLTVWTDSHTIKYLDQSIWMVYCSDCRHGKQFEDHVSSHLNSNAFLISQLDHVKVAAGSDLLVLHDTDLR